ncbi:MAG: histidine kinase dimerization/phosphoacceptor domain -containing protein [Spirochaeta sp.]
MDLLKAERERLLVQLLRYLAMSGVVAYIPSMIASIVNQEYGIAAVNTIAYGLVLFIAYSTFLTTRIKALMLVLCSYAIGTAVLMAVGSDGAGYLWFIFAIAIGAVFARPKFIAVMIALSVSTLLLYAAALHTGYLDHDHTVIGVLAIAANLLLISLVLAFLIYRLLTGMQAAFDQQSRLLQELHHRVYNNLQTVDSLLYMQRKETSSDLSQDSRNDLINDIQREVYILTVINELFLEQPGEDSIDIVKLLASTAVYCAANADGLDGYFCEVLAAEDTYKLTTQNALLIALTGALVFARLARAGYACRFDIQENKDGRVLTFDIVHKQAGGIPEMRAAIQSALQNHPVTQSFFHDSYMETGSEAELCFQIDSYMM